MKKLEMWLTEDFRNALHDYFYLSDRGYPERGFLKLVGDRYRLSDHQRTILYRGVTSRGLAKSRQFKLCTFSDTKNQKVFIDGFNVLLTIGSYLQGMPVFIAMDGFLRDASKFRGRFPKSEIIKNSLQKLLQTPGFENQEKLHFIFDKSAKTLFDWNQIFQNNNNVDQNYLKMSFCENVDKTLILQSQGIVCTSDTEIIDKAPCKIFDLPHHVLTQHYSPPLIDLSFYIPPTLNF